MKIKYRGWLSSSWFFFWGGGGGGGGGGMGLGISYNTVNAHFQN